MTKKPDKEVAKTDKRSVWQVMQDARNGLDRLSYADLVKLARSNIAICGSEHTSCLGSIYTHARHRKKECYHEFIIKMNNHLIEYIDKQEAYRQHIDWQHKKIVQDKWLNSDEYTKAKNISEEWHKKNG